MKDNDIIKALECCKEGNCDDGCPFYGVKEDCEAELPEEALNVINRQQAEIERYKGVIKLLEKDVANAKSETVKEFERKIKAHAYYIDVPKEHRVVDEDDIDAVLKEMTESVNYGSSKTEGNG